MQQYMYKDDNEHGVVTYNNHELSERVNMPIRTIQKCHQDLVHKHLLTIIKTAAIDNTGCNRYAKVFNMRQYMQSVAFIATKHELEIRKHNEQIKENSQDIEIIKLALADLKKQQEANNKMLQMVLNENAELKKQLAEKDTLIL